MDYRQIPPTKPVLNIKRPATEAKTTDLWRNCSFIPVTSLYKSKTRHLWIEVMMFYLCRSSNAAS